VMLKPTVALNLKTSKDPGQQGHNQPVQRLFIQMLPLTSTEEQ
ncbi:hypothetical protein NPIL_691591, partial [Nephila pilipes]